MCPIKVRCLTLIFLICALNCSALTASVTARNAILPPKGIYRHILRILPFQDCGSRYDILYLQISSCHSLPCAMRRGSTVLVNVLFDDNDNKVNFLKHRVRWEFNAIKSDATITPDPCDGNHDCIVNRNDGKSYFAKLLVDSSLPVIHGTMLWEAQDEYEHNVICFRVSIIITV